MATASAKQTLKSCSSGQI